MRIAELTDADVVVVSFFDESRESIDAISDVEEIPLTVRALGGSSRFDPGAWATFFRELKRDYDVLHTHHNFSGSLARILASICGLHIVDTEHRNHRSFSLLQNLVNASTLPLADRVVSNSQATQDSFSWYERRLLSGHEQCVIYNGVDLERIQRVVSETSRSDPDSNSMFRICSVGRLVPVKNHATLLRAFASVVEREADSELLIIGSGPRRQELESFARFLGISDHVKFPGEVPRRRVYQYLARSDVFVMSSHAEGFCVAAVEAMAAGLPVVVSDIEVFHEIVGEAGVFVDPEDTTEFTDAILALRVDETRYSLGRDARERAHSMFSLDKAATEYYNLYKELAETPG
jgi:glycosyltransferase involved in cell wall biosynthesis